MEWSAQHNRYIDSENPPNADQHRALHPRAWAIRGLMFFAIFLVIQLSWEALHGTSVERVIVHDGTVRPAAWLVNLLTPDVHARAIDYSLRAPGGGLNILNGCEGMEALALLVAAFCVAPITWRSRLIGLSIGIAVVFAINQIRILVLFYAYRADHSLFDPLHGTVTPIAVVLLVSSYFYLWLNYATRHAATSA